ncbi:FAD-dependent monooxygenase [Streptomyces sp. NPDC012888]|uniref:FAD-dependent monooxygenase n=1 Tax=Streptomyces sp. NPDC012888 TaxID=3364855 RepID=UPI0036984F9A
MTATPAADVDVAVVGAGPTGLLLAGDLAAAGLSVALLERRPRTAANLTRAFAVHARTLELLDARGLAAELVATGTAVRRIGLGGGLSVDLDALAPRTRFPFVLVTPQYETERLLERRALSTGVDFRYDTELLGLRQDTGDAVELAVRGPDGHTRNLTARHLVGADGHRSTVRRSLGLPFPGRAAIRSVVLADVRLDDPPADVLAFTGNGRCFAFLVPFGDGWHRAIAWDRDHQPPDDTPVELGELRAIMLDALGTDHGMREVRWISRFHSDERQVPRYRVGRAFLAGDAAHVHTPAGGQGMNTGMQDAANLSWKLAAALTGRAPDPEALLDSYDRERHPVGHMVLRSSGALIRMIVAGSPAVRAARTLGGVAFATVPALRDRATGLITGIGIAYAAPPGSRRPAGRRAPDVATADGGRLYELLRAGTFVLLAPAGANGPATAAAGPATAAAGPAAAAAAEVPYLRRGHWRDPRRTTHALIRPDGYVAWSAEDPSPADLTRALATWLGGPAGGRAG